MIAFIDSSVLIAAMVATEAYHEPCRAMVVAGGFGMYGHGITESFSTLTGGKHSFRLPPNLASSMLQDHFIPRLIITSLTPNEMLTAMRDAETRGVRGGAIFDYLHLMAARKAKATRFYTLNYSHFRAFHRAGDPEIVHP